MQSASREELWGAETRKAVENFPVSGEPIPISVARWLGRIKAAAARVNAELGLLEDEKAERIAAGGDRVASGELDDQFPIDVFQTGSGTSSNMNANEVIASLSGDDVHPNDDVNMGQSSNDVFPSAVHLAAVDAFEAQAARDGLVEASGALKTVAVSLNKIANDLRLMGSGPRAGLAELFLPELQKGSSIMPGKVNPVIPEVVTQVAAQVIGNDAAIGIGGLQGHFELNVFIPMMARNLLDQVKLLAAACRLLDEKCVSGIEANRENCERYAELTLSAATALNPYIGYDRASEIVKQAASSGRPLREVARDAGVDDETLDAALDYRAMAKPHSSG